MARRFQSIVTKPQSWEVRRYNFPPKVLDYIHWLANPASKGTKLNMAKKYGKSISTLTEWEKRKGFWQLVWKEFEEYYLQGSLPQINKKLIEMAREGNIRAMEMVYKLAGKIQEKNALFGDGVQQNYFINIIRDAFNNINNKSNENKFQGKTNDGETEGEIEEEIIRDERGEQSGEQSGDFKPIPPEERQYIEVRGDEDELWDDLYDDDDDEGNQSGATSNNAG